jgi:hypothetical protein
MTNPEANAIGETDLAVLEQEIGRLADLEAIYRLRLTYCAHVNESRFDRLPELFTADAQVDFGNELGYHQGHAALAAALAGLDKDMFVKILSHGHVADISGDRADGHLYIEGRLIVGGESFITLGKVSDRYVRAAKGWLIAGSSTEYFYAVPLAHGWADESDNLRPFTSP